MIDVIQIYISKEIFKIRKTDSELFEIEIDYAANSMSIGVPERENHKFCDLKKDKPIRYKINGKSDFTMTGRKERTFYEFDYVFEWIGPADRIDYRELNKMKKSKIIPLGNSKLIDERKILR